MWNLFSFAFWSKYKQSQGHKRREPISGETWYFRGSDGPWPDQYQYDPVKILDVKDGWVRYAMKNVFMDNRMRMSSFIHCYSPEKT